MPDVDELLRGAREALSVTRVFSEPYEHDGVTIIPAATVRGAEEAAVTRTTTAAAASS